MEKCYEEIDAISGESKWTIMKETNIDDYIISCGYSENDKFVIAVFIATSNGKYKRELV